MANILNRRGSVLLMAIGLLTIIAILASTFLIVSNLDAQETETLAVKAMADPIAEGALHATMALIGPDRHAGGDGPYGALDEVSGSDQKLAGYIDSPGDPHGGTGGVRIDEWLAPAGRDDATRQAFWSKIYGADAAHTGVAADTDGDGTDDAWFYTYYDDADANSREGKFKVAVRIVDLSAKVCVNTASDGDPNGPDDADVGDDLETRSPALINLVRAMGGGLSGAQSVYRDRIHPLRCGYDEGQRGPRDVLKEYDTHCGRKLLSPDRDSQDQTKVVYDPFPIGDEVFLLWCEPLRYNSVANVGRLYEATGPYLKQLNVSQDANGNRYGDQVKRLLTTFSCTSAVVRKPDAAKELNELELLNVWNNDQALYKRMKAMLGELGIADTEAGCKRMAAAFVSNLKAYLSAGRDEGPWRFKPDAEDFETYGYKGDVVITEVVGKHQAPSQDGKQDWAWGCAIELMNPTNEEITLDGTFELIIDGSRHVNLEGTVPAEKEGITYKKWVLCHLETGADSNTTLDEFFPGISNHRELGADLDFAGGGSGSVTLELVRNENGYAVPVDQVDASDFNYVRKRGDPPDNDGFVCIQRDDRYAGDSNTAGLSKPLTRFLLPRYTSSNSEQTLGARNSASGGAEYPILFHTVERPAGVQQLISVAELCNIYLAAPASGASIAETEKTFGQLITKDEISGIFRDCYTRGKLGYTQIDDANSTTYPALPSGCLYAEFFTNVARHLRKMEQGRIYGRINVNTATREALLALPWPERIVGPEVTPGIRAEYTVRQGHFDPNVAVQWILDYRRNPGANCGIADLRSDTQNLRAFLTPGEVAIPLAAYMKTVIAGAGGADWEEVKTTPGAFEAVHALYRAVADCITTRSDVFAIYIKVQYGGGGRYAWHYLAVVDRSNVLKKGDTPAVLLFCEVQPTEDEEQDQE